MILEAIQSEPKLTTDSSSFHASAVLSTQVSMTTVLIQFVFMKITLISLEPLGFLTNQYFSHLWIIRNSSGPLSTSQQETEGEL